MPTHDPLVEISRPEPGMVQLMLSRPDKRNALSIALLEELHKGIAGAKERVILLRGKGPLFCAGLDLAEAADPALSYRSSEGVAQVFEAIQATPAVVIGLAHGMALAGGAGLLAACDLVVASKDAQISFPEVRRGLIAALVMAVLKEKIAGHYLSELLLLAEPVGAQRALEMGLVNRVVEITELLPTALRLAGHLLEGAPQAIIRTKQLLRTRSRETLSEALLHHREMREDSEAKEGIQAFLEKRKPRWN